MMRFFDALFTVWYVASTYMLILIAFISPNSHDGFFSLLTKILKAGDQFTREDCIGFGNFFEQRRVKFKSFICLKFCIWQK